MRLQESGEMYLETIYMLSQQQNIVRAIDVGEHMGYSKPSVSRAVGLLKQGGYLTVEETGNLLLSEDATVNSLPGLEILADKVRCSHGSASAPVDEEQLFYLLSRGISREDAIDLLSYGFIKDAIEKYEQS